MTIRHAQPEDAAEIARVFIAAPTTNLAFLNWEYPFEEIRALFANHVLPHGSVFVCEVNAELVGFIAWKDEEIDHLYVHPDHQGKGLGSALLMEVFAESPKRLELWVFQRNLPAIRFYGKHGFRLAYETDGKDNMEKEPDARYVWP
ncbi:MAG TPA: GNAT family N-acetyltransferase [Fimbriimonadaceae bacterium]|nr:GNAT family N-acetyltransferase [Fimbriimonadaceae bacterium]